MSTRPKQFEWWRRREAEAEERAKKGRRLPPERIRALVSAVIVGAIAWVYFYLQFGSHQIGTLEEFERYLQGEDLYRKYEVTRITWDCGPLRTQFETKYLNTVRQRITRDGNAVVFTKSGLDPAAFELWVDEAQHGLRFGQERRIANSANLMPALIVRLFDRFEFRSGELHHVVPNEFEPRCEG